MFLTSENQKPDYSLYVIIAAIFILGIIMLIINGAFSGKSYKTKGIAFAVASLLYSLIFLIALIIDINNNILYPITYYIYFICSGILYFILFALPNLIGRKAKFVGYKEDKKMVYTYREKEEHIYMVFKYNNYIYLNINKQGFDYIMKKSEFTDECVMQILSHYSITLSYDTDRIGIITIKGEKKDIVYYCYLIELSSELMSKDFENISLYELANIEIPDLDKYIIFSCLNGEKFDKIY